jgi:hypothetical protein
MMDQQEVDKIVQICEKIAPFMRKHLIKMMDEHGPNISISVVSSVVTNLMAHAITMVEVKGGDIDDYVRIIMREVSEKQREMSAAVQTHAAIEKIMLPAGRNTCRPLH